MCRRSDAASAPRWLRVDSTNLTYTTGLTLYQHKLITKMARDRSKGHPDEAEFLKSRQALIDLTTQMSKSNKLRLRKVAARVGDLAPATEPDEDTTAAEAATATKDKLMTDIEAKLLEIDQVTLELEDEEEWASSGSTSSAFG